MCKIKAAHIINTCMLINIIILYLLIYLWDSADHDSIVSSSSNAQTVTDTYLGNRSLEPQASDRSAPSKVVGDPMRHRP